MSDMTDIAAIARGLTRLVVPALGTFTMFAMLLVYPNIMVGLKDWREACIMLLLGSGHLAALWCCIAHLTASDDAPANRSDGDA